MSLPNIVNIFSTLKQLPIKAEHLKMIYEAWNMFKGKNLKGNTNEIEQVLSQLNMSRNDIAKALPLLEKPFIKDTLERVMPGSTERVKDLAEHVIKNKNYNNYNDNNQNNNNYNKEITTRFPKLS